MKTAGAVLIVASAASFGFRYGWSVKRRAELIGQLLLGLRLLKGEISVYGTPLPQAFGVLAAATKGSAADFFSFAAREMNRNRHLSPQEVLENAGNQLKELRQDDPVRKVLRDFFAGLGRYDIESQICGISITIAGLEEILRQTEAEKGLRCRTYRALGICAGLALAIVLI